MKFFNSSKFAIAWLLSIIVSTLIGLIDVISMKSGVFGSASDYLVGNYTPGWWGVFFKINVIMICILPMVYYLLVRHDVTEAIALFLSSMILWVFGLADIAFFFFQGKLVPATLPWLDNSFFIHKVSVVFGVASVTWWSLLVSVLIGLFLSYLIARFLEWVLPT